jgi:hypothetical protein
VATNGKAIFVSQILATDLGLPPIPDAPEPPPAPAPAAPPSPQPKPGGP